MAFDLSATAIENIMAIACSEILKEHPELKNWSSGREWYNNYVQSHK